MKRVEVLRDQSAELRRLALTFDPPVRDKFLNLAQQTDELAMEVSREILKGWHRPIGGRERSPISQNFAT